MRVRDRDERDDRIERAFHRSGQQRTVVAQALAEPRSDLTMLELLDPTVAALAHDQDANRIGTERDDGARRLASLQ